MPEADSNRTPGRAPARTERTGERERRLERFFRASRGGRPRDPERTRRLLARLAIPTPANAVHVVGTNGKGSVASMIDAGLRREGLRSGCFTSPHVEAFEERIRIAGEAIAAGEVDAFLARLEREPAPEAPAFFEGCTAMAFDAFARHELSWSVVEAGVGAARDATAALEHVRAVVITNVAEDHLEALGPDVRSIARDKAQAIRPATPVVCGAQGAALEEIAAVASQRRSPLFLDVGHAPLFRIGERLYADAPDQRANQGMAAATLRLLGAGEEAVRAAVTAPPLPARRERFRIGGREVLLDGAHNPTAAAALARATPPGFTLLLGVLARKDPHAMLRALEPAAERIVLTSAQRGEHPWGPDARFHGDPTEALHRALHATDPGGRLVIAGSLHLAGRVRPWLRRAADGPA